MIKKGDTIPGIFTSVIGALALLYVFTNPKMVIILAGNGVSLGPGFFPLICGVGLLLLGCLLALRGVKQNGSVDYFNMTPEKKKNFKLAGLLTLFFALMLAAWKISNLFFLCLPVYAFAVNKLLRRSNKFSIIFTVCITAFIYLLFKECFLISFRA
jgi:uncharacterized membrane protein YciS (DUF1049 family)